MSEVDRVDRADGPAAGTRRRPTTYGLVVLLAAAASIVWVFLTPLGSVPDEPSHVQYATAVVHGQTASAAADGVITIPADVLAFSSRAACTAFASMATTRCQAPITPDTTPTKVANPSAGYPPLYFAIVGLPTLTGFGATTWYAMRLLSVAIGIALLAAFLPVARRYPPGWLVIGSVLAVTPMATYMLASVNPNGPEIFAGLAIAIGIYFLLVTIEARDRVGLVWASTATALALGYLILARPRSYLLAAGLVVVAALVLPRGSVVMARSVGRRLALAAAIPVVAFVVARSFEGLTHPPSSGASGPGGTGAALRTIAGFLDSWTLEMVGFFGWRDFRPNTGLAMAWVAGIAAVVVIALAAGRWRARLGLLVLVVGGTVVAPTFVVLTVFPNGAGYQGRYQMALTVAIPVVASGILAALALVPGPLGRRVAAWVPWATAVLYVLIWGGSILRYALGLPLPGLGQFREIWTWWLNPLGTALTVLALVVYGASVAVLSRRLSRTSSWTEAPPSAVSEPGGDGTRAVLSSQPEH